MENLTLERRESTDTALNPKIKISGCLTAWKERNMEKQTVNQNENTEVARTEKEKTAWERRKENTIRRFVRET